MTILGANNGHTLEGRFDAGFDVDGWCGDAGAAVAEGEEGALDGEVEDGGDDEAGGGEEEGRVPVASVCDAGEVEAVEVGDLFVGEVEAEGEGGDDLCAGDSEASHPGAALGESSGEQSEP